MILASTSLRSLRTRVRGVDAPKRQRTARTVTALIRWAAEAVAPVARPAAAPRTPVPQTPWTGRCACGECGGIALLPIGTVVAFRGAPARVAAWAPQDHWNVPCIDAEGAVGRARDMLDGGPGFTLAEAELAARRTAELAARITGTDAASVAERRRLELDSAAWCDLAGRLAAGAVGAGLNPGLCGAP